MTIHQCTCLLPSVRQLCNKNYQNILVGTGLLGPKLVARKTQNDEMVILTENVEHLLELRVVVVGESAFGRDVDDENDFAAKRLEADVVAVDVDSRQVEKRRLAQN